MKRNNIFLKIVWFMFGLTYNDNRERGEEGEREKRERNNKYYCIREVIRKTERV